MACRVYSAEVDRLAARMRELHQSSRSQHRSHQHDRADKRPASPLSSQPATREARPTDDNDRRHSHPSPLFPSPPHPSFLDCTLCHDGVHTPTTHRRHSSQYDKAGEDDDRPRRHRPSSRLSLSPSTSPSRCSPPSSPRHKRLPLALSTHSLPASPSPSPAVLAALSTLQAKVSDLRLHNRLLTSQLAAERQDSGAKLEDIEAKSRLLIQTLQDRLAARDDEEGRRTERWVREKEGWERGTREREVKLAAMRDRMAQWERQMGVVNAEMRQMGDAIRQREQRTEEERRKREAGWDEEKRAWKQREAEREDDRLELERAMKRLVSETRDMNEELSRRDEKERRLRAALSRLISMDKEWRRLRNERRGVLDGRVLQCVRRQQELLTQLSEARGRAASSEEEKDEREGGNAARETETETADSDREPLTRRTRTAKRHQQSTNSRAHSHKQTAVSQHSAKHKQAVRGSNVRMQSHLPRAASSIAVWPPVTRAPASVHRMSRPRSATDFITPSLYHNDELPHVAGMDNSDDGPRTTRPHLPASFLTQPSSERMQRYKSIFTPHTADGSNR